MEEKKKTNETEVAMVICPFCNKPIEAPAKADVIFACPNCHKELITYDKNAVKNNVEKSSVQNGIEKKTNNNILKNNVMSLVYCKECGKQISEQAPVCPYCGCPNHASNTEISLGYLFVSFLIPLIGIVLCFTSWNKDDGKAKSALIGTLVGVVFTALIYSMWGL